MSVRPGFWEAPVVQKSPHGRVRGLTRENTHEQRLSPLKRRSRPCPAQETSPRWSFGKGLLGRAESSLTSRDRRAQQRGCPASARRPCWPRQPLLSTVTARGGLRPPEDTAHMLGLSPGPGEAVSVVVTSTSQVHGKTLGPQQGARGGPGSLGSPPGHSMSCSSCLCRACSRLTTVWCTASSPSVSRSCSSSRMAARTLFLFL